MNTWRNLPGKIWVTLGSLNPFLRRRARAAAASLSPGEAELFLNMNRYDLAHSMAVASRLGEDPLLYKAALVHDAGKLRDDLGLFTRWLYTCMEIFTPARLRRMGERQQRKAVGTDTLERARSLPKGWERGFYVQLHHGEIGAELLRGIGSDAEVIYLVGGHQGEPHGERAARLKEVDDSF